MHWIDELIEESGRELALLVAVIATTGSLFTSQILGWAPCELCWYQRVFMFPLIPILGATIIWENRNLETLSIGLAAIGAPIALFHHLLVRFDPTQGCGIALPCSMQYQFDLGIVAVRPMYLPLLSFIAFGLIIVILWRRHQLLSG